MRLPATMLLALVVAFVLCSCHHESEQSLGGEPTSVEEATAAIGEMEDDPTPGEIVVHGVAMGKSGKPLAGARLTLAQIIAAGSIREAKATSLPAVAVATVDQEGNFEFKNFPPGTYTIVYLPSGSTGAPLKELDIGVLWASDKSIAPTLQGVELGTSRPFSDRPWGKVFTLLEGHTLNAQGQSMTVRNATARVGQGGPYVEWRRGDVWSEEFADNGEIQFEAWSF